MDDNDDSDPPAFSGRMAARRMHRSDSIPEHSETTTGSSNMGEASIEELLMRHSSPIFNRRTGEAVTSPLTERNSSPSPMRLNRPRSNPRSRTPMRIPEQHEEDDVAGSTTEGQRITIRLGTGSAVGANTVSYASRRTHQNQPARVRSSKQGPSHRKARRWNNSNFVNLAAELSAGKGSASAVEALLKGSAEASKHRSILDNKQHESKAMKKFREDNSLKLVREQFFEGALPVDIHSSAATSKRKVVIDSNALTPLERFHKIETRLRRIVVKACENSYAASKVVNTLEKFLVQVYNGEEDTCSAEEWKEILLDAPVVTNQKKKKEEKIIKFFFDADSSTGGFHRLLLHGLCQFHCLRAASSTTRINGEKARALIATGEFSGGDVRLVDFVTERQKKTSNHDDAGSPEAITSKLSALKV